MKNQAIMNILQEEKGHRWLPLIFVDDKLVCSSDYPSDDELNDTGRSVVRMWTSPELIVVQEAAANECIFWKVFHASSSLKAVWKNINGLMFHSGDCGHETRVVDQHRSGLKS